MRLHGRDSYVDILVPETADLLGLWCNQLVKRKIKPIVKCCNATITRVPNMSGANYKIN